MFLLRFKFFKPRFGFRIDIHPEVKGIFGTQKSNASIDTKVSGAMELLEESNQQLAEINEQIEHYVAIEDGNAEFGARYCLQIIDKYIKKVMEQE